MRSHRHAALGLALALLGQAGPSAAQRAGAAACDVRVVAVVAEQRFSGRPPLSPAQQAYYRTRPAESRMHAGIAHGDSYVRCTYVVALGRARYRYAHHVGDAHRRLPEGHCALATTQAAVAAHVSAFTRGCRDPRAGEYHGYVLAPVAAAPPRP